jgi:hypothetical protein
LISIVHGLIKLNYHLHDTPTDEPSNPLPEPTGGGNYCLKDRTWERIWSYRQVNITVHTRSILSSDTCHSLAKII